ncbi:hypothetical protein NXX78_09740 [Bacteroides fragilis]|nr:hypothetical protein [Bacteroides fragilis]
MKTTLLTKENAHRVTMVRRVDASESEPVAFLFRGKETRVLQLFPPCRESGWGRNPRPGEFQGLGGCGSGASGLFGRLLPPGVRLL